MKEFRINEDEGRSNASFETDPTMDNIKETAG